MTDPKSPRTSAETTWTMLADRLVQEETGVEYGKMMSSLAVTFGGKVFVFYCDNNLMSGIGARLGRDFDIDGLQLRGWTVLSPFKTKPPLKDWFVIGTEDAARWSEIARIALNQMRA